jgi:hypothetical protein
MRERQEKDPNYEFIGSTNYGANRERVAELYGVKPESIHHIAFRRDIDQGHFQGIYDKKTVNQLGNLYPFANDQESRELHATVDDHAELHQKIDEREGYEPGVKKKKRKKQKVIYRKRRR